MTPRRTADAIVRDLVDAAARDAAITANARAHARRIRMEKAARELAALALNRMPDAEVIVILREGDAVVTASKADESLFHAGYQTFRGRP